MSDILWVTTSDSGNVVFETDKKFGEYSDSASLLKSSLVSEVREIRVLGGSHNCHLLRAALDYKAASGLDYEVFTCSPLLLYDRLDFATARNLKFSPSVGGWRKCGDDDRIILTVRDALKDPSATTHQHRRTLRKHRAYSYFSYLQKCDWVHLINVICEIVDPRWFIDPMKPNSRGRLWSFFGLCGKGLYPRLVELSEKSPGADSPPKTRRLWHLIRAWYNKSITLDISDPKSWLAIVYRFYLDTTKDHGKAIKYTSMKLLDYVVDCWIDSETPRPLYVESGGKKVRVRSKKYCPEIFSPSSFFVVDGKPLTRTVKDWELHMIHASLKRGTHEEG